MNYSELVEFFKRRLPLIFLCVLGAFLVPGTVFVCRKPILLVNDRVFLEFYGRNRSRREAFSVSLRLFRRVKPVYAALDAGPDLVSLAVESASSRPYMVFFPYRFRAGADRYSRDHPDVPAAVLAGTIPEDEIVPPPLGPAWFFTDTPTDLYRAGRMAALCSGDSAPDLGEAPEGGDPPKGAEIFYFGDPLGILGRDALERGLSEQEFSGIPRYIYPDEGDAAAPGDPAEGVLPENAPGCTIIRGRGEQYQGAFPGPAAPPLLLFSWMDPSRSPAETVLIFDDSPWAQLVPGVRMLEGGGISGSIPSKIRVLNRKNRTGLIKKLKTLIFMDFQTDN